MAEARKVVGWFYRNGKRIPIFEKGQGKPNKVTSDGNTRDLADSAEKARGVQMDSADRDQIMRNPRSINGERVALYSGGKKESATFNMYSDGGKELINFKREPWPEGLRKNVKARDRKSRNEILDYSDSDAKAYEGVFDVASPRETANLMGKRVRTGDGKIVRPVKRTGIDLETRVNNYAAEVAERELNTPSQTFASASKRFTDKAAAEGKTVYEVNSEGNISGVIRPKNASTRGGKKITVDVTPRHPNGTAMSRSGGSEDTRAYNSKVLDGVKAKIEKYGIAEVSNDRIAGTSKAFMDLAKEAGYTVRSDNKSDSIILSGKKNSMGRTSIKKPAESYIKSVMEDRGLTRTEALKYIKEQRKKK